ncbi:MAG: type II secretion system F family protein [Candidatus Sedimenticola endophacoides]
MPDPIGPEFAITFDEINYGLSINDALYNMGDRVGTEEVRYFIAAVIIQKQTGGNLADLLKRISEMIRRRVRTYRDIRTQAAEMKMSANVLITLPFLVAGAILVLNPNYLMSLVNDPVGPYAVQCPARSF